MQQINAFSLDLMRVHNSPSFALSVLRRTIETCEHVDMTPSSITLVGHDQGGRTVLWSLI